MHLLSSKNRSNHHRHLTLLTPARDLSTSSHMNPLASKLFEPNANTTRFKTEETKSLSKSKLQQAHCLSLQTSKQLKTISKQDPEDIEQSKYTLGKVINKGSFGTIFSAVVNTTGARVVIKKVVSPWGRTNKELAILKAVQHPNIIRLIDHYFKREGHRQFLYLIFQQKSMSLKQYLTNKLIDPHHNKIFLYQLLKGLAYLSKLRIAHRDLKPQNIVVNEQLTEVKICDFGSAKHMGTPQGNVAYICSRLYRAPQLVFGSSNYSEAVDMWSWACIAFEAIAGRPLFAGSSNIELMLEMIQLMGCPTWSEMQDMNPQYSIHEYSKLPKLMKKKGIKHRITWKDQGLLDLIEKVLVYSPKQRLTPAEALAHSFFSQFNQNEGTPKKQSEAGSGKKSLFDRFKVKYFETLQTSASILRTEQSTEYRQERVNQKLGRKMYVI